MAAVFAINKPAKGPKVREQKTSSTRSAIMNLSELFQQIQVHFDEVVAHTLGEGHILWERLIEVHPADIAQFISHLPFEKFQLLFLALPSKVQNEVFANLSNTMKVTVLRLIESDHQQAQLLHSVNIDQLTDMFEHFSDAELLHYLGLLNAQERKKIRSLLKFHPESAGGIMDPTVLSFIQDFTIEKSIHVLQRVKPEYELYNVIYVTDKDNKLVGHIRLEDLVLKSPKLRLQSILRKNDFEVPVTLDRGTIAKQMVHYSLMTVPVISDEGYFLGAIPSVTLIDIIEQEASEDVYKMSAMAPIKYPYFETPFFRILYERSYILIALLLAQSISSMIIDHYHTLLSGFLISFITMLISTGGNTSSQTSAVVIQGMASGDINHRNVKKFLRREFAMAFFIAFILGIFAFLRVWIIYGNLLGSVAVSLSLAAIVFFAVLLGSCTPLIFHRLNIDPAFAAGPFLATLMDIIGLLVYCYISSFILG
jgi:magnesium transporter